MRTTDQYGEYYFFPGFGFNTTETTADFGIRWQWSDYGPDHCDNSSFYNKIAIYGFGNTCYAVSTLSSSTYFDREIKSVITYDSDTGSMTLDIGGDGSIDFSAVTPADKRFPIKQINIGGYGWWTGHYHQINSFNLVSLDDATVLNYFEPINLFYYVDGYRDYDALTEDQVYYINLLPRLSKFSYAVENGQFNIKKLSATDRALLVSMMIGKGVSMSSSLFQGVASDAFKKKQADHFAKWDQKLDKALQKADEAISLSSIDFSQWAEFGTVTIFNLADGVADAITVGSFATAQDLHVKLGDYVLKGANKSNKVYKRAMAIKEILDSSAFKLTRLCIENGWVFNSQLQGMISGDAALQEELKNIGVVGANFVIGNTIEAAAISKLNGYLLGKLSSSLIQFFADVLLDRDTTDKGLLKPVLEAMVQLVPFAGPVYAEWTQTQEILSRQNSKEIIAWKNYMSLQKQFTSATQKLHAEVSLLKLQMTLNEAQRRFSTMNNVTF